MDLTRPVVMGILNITSDSFFADSRSQQEDEILALATTHHDAGAVILDIGAMSTRPKADEIPIGLEAERLAFATELIHKHIPHIILSADTYRHQPARSALESGAHVINDISGGLFDDQLLSVVGSFNAPYILMHNRAKSAEMHRHTDYDDLVFDMMQYLSHREAAAREAGIIDIIIDPGIGFSKTIEQNFEIMSRLHEFSLLRRPLLIGLSRKSFIYKTLGTTVERALNGTTAMHMVALQGGATILRAHDVQAARECIDLYNEMNNPSKSDERP